METPVFEKMGFRETALETSLVEWKRVEKKQPDPMHQYLGNFLSGMETRLQRRGRRRNTALETSLVEWKQCHSVKRWCRNRALETSLVEWKHPLHGIRRDDRMPWKLP